jgi:hypothetical protein
VNQKSVRKLLDSGLEFALYRFPGEKEPHLVLQTDGEAQVLDLKNYQEATSHYGANNEPSGFIFAPFVETSKMPTLLIKPDIAVSGWELINLEVEALNKKKKRIVLSSIVVEDRDASIDEHEGY